MAATHGRKPTTDDSIFEPHILRGNLTDQVQAFSDWAAAPKFRILDTIKHDHREITSFYELLLKATEPDDATKCQNQFVWELARHAVAEELVVYPAMEKYLDGGKEMADRDRAEHQTVKERLKLFQDLKSTDPRFLPTLTSLMADLKEHMMSEEAEDIPRLDSALSEEESVGLSQSLNRTKIFVPSRSHPSAPSAPPFETAVGLLTAPLDHIADVFRKWPS
ncbi:HHE domain protein [Aspergillus clavatus NRRL 1]|uniref:HHE domain protein n=1 Tax=Aspergillus clavatus (strain ATCC 1007 / CBS 513.65 / DSM 816 / NCTC 3887 / NRRL 1 / QM 1276 / 107) TaxID=344612 RepID=A1CL46_ASPCL|nr:HHE domain protein [Aspergillus clavatus NRRL 1]EAW09870.1 HHE domain protein [Aspergillus clavatus NRRL 1]